MTSNSCDIKHCFNSFSSFARWKVISSCRRTESEQTDRERERERKRRSFFAHLSQGERQLSTRFVFIALPREMSSKHSARLRSMPGRFGYSRPLVESTVNSSPNVVRTTGPVLAQESIIPIASLFSSVDLPRPSSNMRKASVTPSPMRRSNSFYHNEPSNEHTNT
jgi:hypothetical protein